jgi:hypothetical protein
MKYSEMFSSSGQVGRRAAKQGEGWPSRVNGWPQQGYWWPQVNGHVGCFVACRKQGGEVETGGQAGSWVGK